ncbi:hypothetical protein N9K85_03800 [Flavobacteriaceae bacterium]|nr:hypothetical protein [Flavobacteriaceae bacterium]
MQLISNNPFRILGVKANASLSDRNQQANLIAQYLKIGQSAKLDLDITPPLEPLTRTKELIDLQASRIFSTEDKILHSLFWFVEANGIDKIALKHLTGSKDIHKALSDFEKGCRGFVVSPESYSAILNHSTLQIIAYKQHKDLDKLKSAIANKFDIITNKKTLAQIKDLVASDGINTDFQKILELTMSMVKELLNELVPSENTDKLLLDIFKSNTVIYPVLKNQVIEALLDKVSAKVDKAENEMKIILHGTYQNSMISAGVTLGKRLIKETKKTLKEIEVLLGKSDPIYIEAMDKVFSQVNFHGILPFNMLIQKINESESNFYLLLKCDLSMVISLYNSAIRNLSGLDLPIKETLKNNKKGVEDTNSQITIIKTNQARQARRQQYNSSDNGQCFIATAALGSYDHSQVIELRHFRDQWILTKNWGAGFVKWYYHYGAIAAKFIEKSFTLRKLSYVLIVKPLVILSRIVKNK